MILLFIRNYLLKFGVIACLILYLSFQLSLFDSPSVHWILVPTLCTTICSIAYQVPFTTLVSVSGRSAFKIGLMTYILTSTPWILMLCIMHFQRDDFEIRNFLASLTIAAVPLAIPQGLSEVGIGINSFLMLVNTRIVETFNSKDIYSSLFHSTSLGNYATITFCEIFFIASAYFLWEHRRFLI